MKTRGADGTPRHVSAVRTPTYAMPICDTCHHTAALHRLTERPPRSHKECGVGDCTCPQYLPAVAS